MIQPVAYTIEEGGRWKLWPPTQSKINALMFSNGDRWDTVNGVTKEFWTIEQVEETKETFAYDF